MGATGPAGALNATQLTQLNQNTATLTGFADDAYGTASGGSVGYACPADSLLGQIILTPYDFPVGMPANGQLLSISQYLALFSLIGTAYGGNGINNFAVPDRRSITPAHMIYSICLQGVFPSRS